MRHLIKHLGIIHNDLAGSCLDLIINLVTTSGLKQTQLRLLSSLIPKLAIDYLNAGRIELILKLVEYVISFTQDNNVLMIM